MPFVLHIFKKDVRRLWWGMALALALQAVVVWGEIAWDGLEYSWLLLLAWVALLAMAVQDDALVGDRQFWLTRPARWRELLGSKLLFAAAVVHVPSLVADIVVLGARGFLPWQWLPQLALKQAGLLAVVTLPAIAVGAVMGSFATLVLALLGVVGVLVVASRFTRELEMQWSNTDGTLGSVCLAAAVLAMTAMILAQYARRQTWRSRAIGWAGLAVVCVLLIAVSPFAWARLHAWARPIPKAISFQLSTRPRAIMERALPMTYGRGMRVSVPVDVSGLPEGASTFFDLASIELIANGRHYRGEHFVNSWQSVLEPGYIGPDWLMFQVPRALYDSLKDTPLELRATVVAAMDRVGAPVSLLLGQRRPIPGAGICSSREVETPGYDPLGRVAVLTASCESPDLFALPPDVAFGPDSRPTPSLHVRNDVLSPLSESHWSVRYYGRRSDAQIVAEHIEGWQVIDVRIPNLKLSDYEHRGPS